MTPFCFCDFILKKCKIEKRFWVVTLPLKNACEWVWARVVGTAQAQACI